MLKCLSLSVVHREKMSIPCTHLTLTAPNTNQRSSSWWSQGMTITVTPGSRVGGDNNLHCFTDVKEVEVTCPELSKVFAQNTNPNV